MKLRPTLVLVSVLTVASGVLATSGFSAGPAPAYGPPTESETLTEGCTDATDGEVLVQDLNTFDVFVPPCVVVENGERVTFANNGDRFHDPGDVGEGTPEDPEAPDCFSARSDIDQVLSPDESYSVEFTFDESAEKLNVTALWFDGERLPEQFVDDEPCPDHVWEYASDDEERIRIDYVCHIHERTGEGAILIEV